jgi:hypothetical protein
MGQTLTPSSEKERFSAPVRTSQMMTRRWSEGPSGEYVTRYLQALQNVKHVETSSQFKPDYQISSQTIK